MYRSMTQTSAHSLAKISDVEANAASFARHLRAENAAPKTVKTYLEAVTQLADYLREQGMPQRLTGIRREHVEAFMTYLLDRWTPATANVRYGGLRAFFKWAQEEGEVKESPMTHMRPPRVPERAVPLLSPDELKRLFATCRGRGFPERRDHAILRTFTVTGARKSEIAGLRFDPRDPAVNDVDLDAGQARLFGKGDRERLVALDPRTVRAIDRYLRLRAGHPEAATQWLWLGKRGRLTSDGISQMAQRRAREARIEGFHLHRLRHTFAHEWLADGGGETDLMRLAGWRSRTMLQRYAASAAQERALAASQRFGIGNRI